MKFAPLVLLLFAGCADRLPLVGAPCPCAAGTKCDLETNQCVAALGGTDALAPAQNDTLAPAQNDTLAPADVDPGPSSGPCSDTGLEIVTLADFETKFIAPRCGQSKCHGSMSVFPPRNLDMPGMIRAKVVGQRAQLACKNDFYVNTTDFRKSFMLHKIQATGDTLPCPSDPTGKPDTGGTRMPNKTEMPTIVGPRLTEGELKCFAWWIEGVSRL